MELTLEKARDSLIELVEKVPLTGPVRQILHNSIGLLYSEAKEKQESQEDKQPAGD